MALESVHLLFFVRDFHFGCFISDVSEGACVENLRLVVKRNTNFPAEKKSIRPSELKTCKRTLYPGRSGLKNKEGTIEVLAKDMNEPFWDFVP